MALGVEALSAIRMLILRDMLEALQPIKACVRGITAAGPGPTATFVTPKSPKSSCHGGILNTWIPCGLSSS